MAEKKVQVAKETATEKEKAKTTTADKDVAEKKTAAKTVKAQEGTVKKTAAKPASANKSAESKTVSEKKTATSKTASAKTEVKPAAAKTASATKTAEKKTAAQAPAKVSASSNSSDKASVKSEAVKTESKTSAAPKKAVVEKKAPAKKSDAEQSRLKLHYKNTVVPALIKKFGYKNVNQVPKLDKIVLNMGLGDVKDNSKSVQMAIEELKMIAGQKPIPTKAKKSVANFKLRQGAVIGAKVTLRGERMYDFLDKFISIALPRVRDFRGLSDKSFDGRGNYATGIKEQLIFPEISYDQIEKIRGFDICFVTTAKNDEEAKEFLKLLGLPFVKKEA